MICHARTPDQRAQLLACIARQVREEPGALVGDMPYHLVAVVRGGRLTGVVLFLNYRRQSMEFHLCGGPGWISRADIRELFRYAFEHVGCLRLWCLIRRNNKPARRGAERLGFKVLSVADDEFGPGKDGIIYSMRRADCKWLKQAKEQE